MVPDASTEAGPSTARSARCRRIGALAFTLAMCVAAGVSGAEAARTQRAAVGQVTIGRGVQLVRPFNVEAPTTATVREFDRGSAALALVRLRAQDVFPGWTIAFRPARPGLLGMTLVKVRRVEIYVRLDRPLGGIAHDIAHEFGHVADVMLNNDDRRRAYLDLRNRPDGPWWTCNGCGDLQVGAGDFAETFALWAAPAYRFYSEFAPRPTPGELEAFGSLLPAAVVAAATAREGPETDSPVVIVPLGALGAVGAAA